MRYVIAVVGCQEQMREEIPRIVLRAGEPLREVKWYACDDQENPAHLIGDAKGSLFRLVRTASVAHHFYQYVRATKLWSGKRPLVLVRGRSLVSRVTAIVGRFGGGDVVMPKDATGKVLGLTRYMVLEDGSLELIAK